MATMVRERKKPSRGERKEEAKPAGVDILQINITKIIERNRKKNKKLIWIFCKELV